MATKRRKLGNPLALAVMVLLTERPMHPYEIAQTLRSRGKDTSLKINYGSLYTVVQNLEKHGFVEVAEVQRQGNRPERTLYGITDAGREEATEWLSDLLAVPAREFPIFEAALSLMGVIHPDEVARLLTERLKVLDVQAAERPRRPHEAVRDAAADLPRRERVPTAHGRGAGRVGPRISAGARSGALDGVKEWRSFHETGEVPPEFEELEARHFDKE
jgi:DNA-binding PadR family transcriptional regulator